MPYNSLPLSLEWRTKSLTSLTKRQVASTKLKQVGRLTKLKQGKFMSEIIQGTQAVININDIFTNKVSLRPVDQESEEFQTLLNSVRLSGVLQPIQVRPHTDPETGKVTYGLINGLQRMTAAKLCGFTEIMAVIRDVNDLRLLEEQIITNVVNVPTKPHQYGKQLNQILELDPSKTIKDLAVAVNMSESWVKMRLAITDLNDEIGRLVDEGRIKLVNAVKLAELPVDVQADFVAEAASMTENDFAAIVKERKDAIRKAKLAQRPSEPVFNAEPALRKFADIKEQRTNLELAKTVVEASTCTTLEDAFLAGIAWVLQLDPTSIAARKKLWEEKLAESAAKREKSQEAQLRRKADIQEINSKAARMMVELCDGGMSREEAEKKVTEFKEAELAKLKAAAAAAAN